MTRTSRQLDTYEINLDPGFSFNGPVAVVPTDLGTDPLLQPPEGYQVQSVNPGPLRPGDVSGMSNFRVSQDVSCVDPFNLYNRHRGSMLWLAAYELTLDETNGAVGGGVLYLGRPNQGAIPIRLIGAGETQTGLQGCIVPLLPGWVIYTRVQDAVGDPLPGEHKLTLLLAEIQTTCEITCAMATSQVLQQAGGILDVPCPTIETFQNDTGGDTLAQGVGQLGTLFGTNLTESYTIVGRDINGDLFPVTLGPSTPTDAAISCDTSGAALGTATLTLVPANLFCEPTVVNVDIV